MAKNFNSVLQKEVEQERKENIEQEKLRKKHSIGNNESIYIIEKDNTLIFLIRILTTTLKIIFFIILIMLATLGLISVVYPNIRAELLIVMVEAYKAFVANIQ